jgi:hypothetical protein
MCSSKVLWVDRCRVPISGQFQAHRPGATVNQLCLQEHGDQTVSSTEDEECGYKFALSEQEILGQNGCNLVLVLTLSQDTHVTQWWKAER